MTSLIYQTAMLAKDNGYHINVFNTKNLFHASVTVHDGTGLWTDPFLEENLDTLERRIKIFLDFNKAISPEVKPNYNLELKWCWFSRKWSGEINIDEQKSTCVAETDGLAGVSRVQHTLLQKLFI